VMIRIDDFGLPRNDQGRSLGFRQFTFSEKLFLLNLKKEV